MAHTLMGQWDSLMCELFSKGFLDDFFEELEMLNETSPNFVNELFNIYCEDNDKVIDELITLFKQPTMDWQKLHAHINNLIGSSASMGACRVKDSAKQLYQFWQKRDKEGCNQALVVVQTEFHDTCAKFKEMIELKEKINNIFNPKKKSPPEPGSAVDK